jgi:cell division protein FtsZ
MSAPSDSSSGAPKRPLVIKVLGVGGAGGNAVEQMACEGMAGVAFIALNTDSQALSQCAAPEKFQLGARLTRGLGAGGDPEMGRAAAEADLPQLRALCAGADMIFIVTGLGGGTGTGASPVLARLAKESGALVLGVATLPFEFEGARRLRQAQAGLEQLKIAADGVICLPNQKVFSLHDENTSFVEMFQRANGLLGEGVRGVTRLLTQTGLINIDFADLCSVVRGRHSESSFAAAEAMGPARAREVVEKLLANPLLDGGHALSEADAVLVSITGGPDLTMADVSRVMEQINRQCDHAHLIMGAAIEAEFADRLAITLVASRRPSPARAGFADAAAMPVEAKQFLGEEPEPVPPTHFKAPAPPTTPERTAELLGQQGDSARARRRKSKMRQEQLPLEIISKGRFERSEPTVVKGEDLDVPTYIRRGVALN